MALKYHSDFKYVHGSRFIWQSKNKGIAFKIFINLLASDVDLVKHMQVGGDMKNSWIMFDHVKCLKDQTTMACHVYDNKYCKVLIIMGYDMQFEHGII